MTKDIKMDELHNDQDPQDPFVPVEVKDGVRTLKFRGALLASSSSREPGKPRWVDFNLYITPNHVYVLSRVGNSILYHGSRCKVVSRNNLKPVDGLTLAGYYMPCPICKVARADPYGVFPETPRFWAQKADNAVGIVSLLMKRDENNSEYLTNVARRLLEKASEYDPAIAEAFYTDILD